MNKIRLFKAGEIYPRYLNYFYKNEPGSVNLPYSEHISKIMADSFYWADFWKINLEKTGDFIVEETLPNNKLLQLQWAKEHRIKFSDENWFYDILDAQISEFKPDIFFTNEFQIKPEYKSTIRKKHPSIKLVIGWDGILRNDKDLFRGCDIVLSCVQDSVDYYLANGFRGLYFIFGFETEILNRIKISDPFYESTFVGSLYSWGHTQRLRLMAELTRKAPFKIWASSFAPDEKKKYLVEQLSRIRRGKFKDLADVARIRKVNQGKAFGLRMYQILADSKITINSHIDFAGNKAANIRLFEATGTGTCLLTDMKDNLKDFFDIDKEIVTYNSINECIDKVNYLLENDSERKAIAKAGQMRTLRDYNLEKRFSKFAEFLSGMI
ncbi:MAG: glycosyltransferase family 1 protein [Ignavibacteriae bacterium]|nr:glycosyltransferase family 1 protein [Ignavibacteriota bacterium]